MKRQVKGMGNKNQRRGSTRTAGLAVSAVVALGFVALVGFYYLRGRAGAPVHAGAQTIRGEAPPDIRSGVPGQAIGAGRGMEVTLVDRHDPSRISMRIISESSEPRENARYIVQRPRGFIYARDGRAYHVSADTGVLHIPNTQMRPESATLEGNVIVRVFEGQAPGARFDPDDPSIPMLARFDTRSIQYDGTLGEVTTTDPFLVTTEKARFTAVGLRGIFNQEQDRLEYGEIHRDGHLVYMTAGEDPLGARKKQADPAPAPTGRPGAPPAPKPAPVETFYVASLTGGVVVTRGSQSIESDALDGWIRLVDNKLAENAVAPAPVRATLTTGSPASHPDAAPTEATPGMDTPATQTASDEVRFDSAGLESLALGQDSADPPSAEAGPLDAGSDRPLTGQAPADGIDRASSDVIDVKWTGAMVIRISEDRPAALGTDQVSVRFTTGPDSLCLFSDRAARATATASTIDYAATSRVLRLASLTPGGVHLRAEGSGNAVSSDLTVRLGTGVASIAGPGFLRDRTDRYLVWSDQAEFRFKVDDGGMTSLIEFAQARGGVEAVQGASRLSGSELTASFAVSDSRSDIYKLSVLENARAVDGSGGELSSAELDVFFDAPEDASAPSPSTIDARGGVLGQKDGAMLEAHSVRVVLEPDNQGRPSATSLTATGAARFVRAKGKDGGRGDLVEARS
ncbi:MAG TPA: LPS export ABC transporter periplasmic protein LptC, partial [Phycisphaerales bacterium]|nr:LPS export ABC transporter periplasmic protein LptC [Phycisphaerales bacterium]